MLIQLPGTVFMFALTTISDWPPKDVRRTFAGFRVNGPHTVLVRTAWEKYSGFSLVELWGARTGSFCVARRLWKKVMAAESCRFSVIR
jgi:hypothetical protein